MGKKGKRGRTSDDQSTPPVRPKRVKKKSDSPASSSTLSSDNCKDLKSKKKKSKKAEPQKTIDIEVSENKNASQQQTTSVVQHEEIVDVEELLKELYKEFGRPEDVILGRCRNTVGQVLDNITYISTRFNLSKDCITAIASQVMQFLPYDQSYQTTMDLALEKVKQVKPSLNESTVSFHCGDCLNPDIQSFNSKCAKCFSSLIAVNVQSDLAESIKYLFEHQDLANLILEYKMYKDGSEGDKQSKVIGPYNLSLILNISGFPAFAHPTAKVWSLLFTIHELPVLFRKKFVMPASLWYTPKEKSNLNEFLEPFVALMRKLGTDGVDWTHPVTKQKHNSKILVRMCVAGAEARAKLLNLNSPSELFSCSFCEIPGQKLNEESVSFACPDFPYELRTSERMLMHALTLEQVRKEASSLLPSLDCILGVKGASAMAQLPYFDVGQDVCPDDMETLLLGVVKTHLKDIFDSSNAEEEFYIGQWQEIVSDRMKAVATPVLPKHMPWDIGDLDAWTSTDLKNWLLYLSLPCLEKLWPEDMFFEHYAMLVFAVYTISDSKASQKEQDLSRIAIEKFQNDYGYLYGEEKENLPLHVLSHLLMSRKRFGPLYTRSARLFENSNMIVKKKVSKGAEKGIPERLVQTAKFLSLEPVLSNFVASRQSCLFLGKPVEPEKVSARVLNFIERLYNGPTSVTFYQQIEYRGLFLTSRCKPTDTSSFYITYSHTNNFNQVPLVAQVLYYCNLQSKFSGGSMDIFVGQKVVLKHPRYRFKNMEVKHILNYEETNHLVWGQIFFIKSPAINIVIPPSGGYSGCKVLCIPPNLEDL